MILVISHSLSAAILSFSYTGFYPFHTISIIHLTPPSKIHSLSLPLSLSLSNVLGKKISNMEK